MRPGSRRAFCSSVPSRSITADATTVGDERARCHGPAEFLDDDDEFGQSVTGAAVLLADVQAQPAERGQVAPEQRAGLVRRIDQLRGPRPGPSAR